MTTQSPPQQPPSSQLLLREAYQRLEYVNGSLLDGVEKPDAQTREDWLEKGDWLALADQVGVEKIFFVNNDPVIVFYDFKELPTDKDQLDIFRRVWCMARPQCLFMALPGELRVYSLNQTPARSEEDWQRIKPLAIARSVPEVASKLNEYRREQVELGRIFADERFGKAEQRADQRLIQDLKTVRKALLTGGLSAQYTHALIGRSIFVRYLEDRGVLTPAYFEQVAKGNKEWESVLSEKLEGLDLTPDWENRRYDRVLQNKSFTYALFNKLAEDFNGDMFPRDEKEEDRVRTQDLHLIRDFLLGNVGSQQSLFFWAYNFNIIPIDLISSIYEEFYHEGNDADDDKGTHYTPSVLVEHVLSKVLTVSRLAENPKVLDPACGSGIFLVEAFRRIVRFRVQKERRLLAPDELRTILREQITGIEINREASHVAAFSLYLALLHYQVPPDILSSKRLPHLIYTSNKSYDERYYDVIFNANTFSLTEQERLFLEDKLLNLRFSGRAQIKRLCASDEVLPIEQGFFDVIVGNPPWGFKKGATREIREAQNQAQLWCRAFDWSIGHKELSQAFIARTLKLIKPGGECALLVSTGILFKHHEHSEGFREKWLNEVTLLSMTNFAHVRHDFFSASAPFAFIHYIARPSDITHRIHYWSAKKTASVNKAQAVILSATDLHRVRQDELLRRDYLWKVYWWGSHRDANLISALKMNRTLKAINGGDEEALAGRGFENDFPSGDHRPSGWLNDFKQLPINQFRRYGSIDLSALADVPRLVHRHGNRSIYSGWRLLVKRGITQAEGANGQIEARIDDLSYCFTNSIHGLRLDGLVDWQRKLLIGILWSSLARYYFFLTASSWGTWHYELHLEEVMNLPVLFTEDLELRNEIIDIVTKLQKWQPEPYSWFNPDGLMEHEINAEFDSLTSRLDIAIFKLYRLSESEVDLVLDMCELGLDLFYNRMGSLAVQPVNKSFVPSQGVISILPKHLERRQNLEGYLRAFLEIWNQELEPEGEFRWRIVSPTQIPMIAIVFTTQVLGESFPKFETTDEEEWEEVLRQCSEALLQPISRRVYIDGMVRAVTDTDILIIKRDELRLWTRSQAREDAEATLLQAMQLQSDAAYENTR